MNHKFPYKWNLKDGYPAKGIEKNNLNVFGTFICGGGSTMGYKLAGFNHLGGVEIDKKVSAVYKLNHNPKYLFTEDIRDFNKRTDLPDELYNLDILDGSPPCSTFSMAGSREKAWGKEKQFREGQSFQTLDDLVFVYCDTIIKLQPKVFILENVKGIIQGNAKVYSKQIVDKMTKAGYTVQVFCLNAASMGVPQKRERVFFIGHKKELNYPKLILEFNEKGIMFGEISDNNDVEQNLSELYLKYYDNAKENKPVGKFMTNKKLCNKDTSFTLTGQNRHFHPTFKRRINNNEVNIIQTFPLDYNYNGIDHVYLCAMSVPPVMTAQISHQIYLQWLSTPK